jgi:two-component system, OmpR family, phosphate regulon sensor histidine kinase PhoR
VLTRKLTLLLVGLAVLGGAVSFLTAQLAQPNASTITRNCCWATFLLMTLLGVVLVTLLWRNSNRSLQHICSQLKRFTQANQIGMVMVDDDDELSELAQVLNQYLTNVRFNFEQHRLRYRELQLQAGAAETEKYQLEAVIYGISEAVLVTDEHNELLLANQTAQDLFSFNLQLNYRVPVEQVLDDRQLLQLIRQVRQTATPVSTCMLEKKHPITGKTLNLKVVAGCVRNTKKQVVGVVVVVHDLTAEQEIARLKDDIVSSVSHELKTPLASIRAYAEMLADNEANDRQDWQEFCDIIQTQAQRLNRLIDDILDISRIESGSLKVFRQPLEVNKLIADIVATMRPQAREKNISLAVELLEHPLTIIVERDMIFHALLNLLSNAIKYSRPGGEITVRTYLSADDEVVFVFQDQGVGIPADSMEHIFDKFYRVPGHEDMAGGTGLGLNLVQKVVQTVHDGRVTVDSQPGHGSTFTVFLPRTVIANKLVSPFQGENL